MTTVLVTGEGHGVRGLKERLANTLGLDARDLVPSDAAVSLDGSTLGADGVARARAGPGDALDRGRGVGRTEGRMNTLHVNLLPQKRIGAIAAVRLARWWAFGGVAYCAVAFIAAGVYSLSVSRSGAGSDNSAVITARLEAKRAEKQTLTGHVTDLRKRVDAARAVGHHPDWSVLLRHLALARPNLAHHGPL
jgi:hypothetical protein